MQGTRNRFFLRLLIILLVVTVGATVVASGAVLCAVGMLTSLFNGRSAWYSAVRQLLFGCLAAAVTYGIGAAFGTSLS